MTMRRIPDAGPLGPEYDIVSVGAGPAGMSAAIEASGSGARLLVVDENLHPGGLAWWSFAIRPASAPT